MNLKKRASGLLLAGISLGFLPQVQIEKRYEPCGTVLQKKQRCWLEIAKLRPTQFAVGFRWIAIKNIEISKMSKEELFQYRKDKKVPIILGPDQSYFMIDRHHTLSALFDNRIEEALIEVVQDWSKLSWKQFWQEMEQSHNVYLFDEQGRKKTALELPLRLKSLKDDPYRSLASLVAKHGRFEKTGIPFEEFYWARLFQSKAFLKNVVSDKDWEQATETATSWRKTQPHRHRSHSLPRVSCPFEHSSQGIQPVRSY